MIRCFLPFAQKALCGHFFQRTGLQVWLPDSVSGCVPGRRSRPLSLKKPHSFTGSGLTTPSLAKDVVHLWQDFLSKSQRCPEFFGGLGPPFGATTGVPEKDPLSVVAMVAICWLASIATSPRHSHFRSYVDNWSWLGTSEQCLHTCLRKHILLSGFGSSYRLAKILLLGHQPSFAAMVAPRLLLEGIKLQRVDNAKDLGICFRFSKPASLSKGEPRLHEGLRRLQALSRQPRPIANKAYLIQVGIWPQCFLPKSAVHCPQEWSLNSAAMQRRPWPAPVTASLPF